MEKDGHKSLGRKRKERKEIGEKLFCGPGIFFFFPFWPYITAGTVTLHFGTPWQSEIGNFPPNGTPYGKARARPAGRSPSARTFPQIASTSM